MRDQAPLPRPTPVSRVPTGREGLDRNARKHSSVAIALLVFVASTARAALPDPLPCLAGARITPVLDDARIHGVPTRIRQFETEAPISTVRSFYQQALDGTPLASRVDGWEVLAWKQGTSLRTVRLRPCRSAPGACTEGTLSESELSASAASSPPAPGRPPGSLLSTDLEMNDPGRRARLLVWHDESSPSWAAARLVRELSARGMALERRVPLSRPGLDGMGLWFGAQGREAVATIVNRGGGTTVTLQMIDHTARGAR